MSQIKEAAERLTIRVDANPDIEKLETFLDEETKKIISELPIWYLRPLVLLEFVGIGQEWLVRPLRRMNGLIPLEGMFTEKGAKEIEEILFRFLFGVYS